MVRFQNDEDEPFGVFGARLAKGRPSYTQDESPVGNTLTGRALRRFDVDSGAENGTGDTERPGLVADAPTAA